MKKRISVLLIAAMVLSMTACSGKTDNSTKDDGKKDTVTTAPAADTKSDADTTPAATEAPAEEEPVDPDYSKEFITLTLNNDEYKTTWQTLYDECGKSITIDDVIEDPETGLAYISYNGELRELGLDFLSMAMILNCTPAGDYKTAEDVYAAWFKYYITRWNSLLPEIPLYSNEYYELYNAQIQGQIENPTNPYWNVPYALIDWTSSKEDNSIIIGNTTELSGQFRYATYGKTNPNAADNDISKLTSGYSTIAVAKDGGTIWNDQIVEKHTEQDNADGSKTYTITIKKGLQYSDGTEIKALDYLVFPMAFYSLVPETKSGRHMNASSYAGYKEYQAYTGPGSTEGTKEFSGFRLLDEYTFSVTIDAAQLPNFYDYNMASFDPSYPALYLGNATLKDDGNGVYITDEFWEKNADGEYVVAVQIHEACTSTDAEVYAKYPWAGPYVVKSFDKSDSTAVLVKNPYFSGNYEGATPSIEKVIYKKVISATQLEDFKAGGIDVITGITGGAATDEALALADNSDGKYVYTHFSRAGYGKLGFRCDYGPAMFKEVRQAIAFCMNRGQFAKDFTGGYGGVVDGPYFSGAWMYKEAVKQGMILNTYATSADSAIEVLKQGGWNYAADGSAYTSGVRYKKIPGDIATENIKNYKSVDGTYYTTEVNGDFYMPLVINWYGTADNEFTDLLQTGFKANDNIATAGMVVYNTIGDFGPMLDELYQQAVYGYYSGSPMYCAFNFATGYNSTVYDYSYNMSPSPEYFDDYSSYYIKDYADIFFMN